MESIATRALAARKFAKMTQKQAEAASGVKQSSISKIERGDVSRSMSVLALARAYRADPNWLDTGDGPAPWDEDQIRQARDKANEPPGPYRVTHIAPLIPSFSPRTPGTVPSFPGRMPPTGTATKSRNSRVPSAGFPASPTTASRATPCACAATA